MTLLYRLMLLAYPPQFRREYGDAMLQTVRDQQVHSHRPAGLTLVHEFTDVALTAPRMRWEIPMTRMVLIALGVVATIGALLAGGPLSFFLIAAVVVLALLVRAGRSRDVDAVLRQRRWAPWVVVAVVGLGAAVAIAQLADGELSAVWWTMMALCGLVGIAAAVVAIGVFLTQRSHGIATPNRAP